MFSKLSDAKIIFDFSSFRLNTSYSKILNANTYFVQDNMTGYISFNLIDFI